MGERIEAVSEETVTLTRSELAALIEAAVSEALAEAAEALRRDEVSRAIQRDYAARPENRERARALRAERLKDPARRERRRTLERERYRRMVNDPTSRFHSAESLEARRKAGREHAARKRAESKTLT